ncbi:MAG: hypothetical protein HOF36_01395 [Candidatus Marinimicrobia bacterium]|jgi:hypothetical protein|nr:hypothetical protein [Candidatus Neomarinimicrobiota bacterium]MBT3949709.1 hypothetical protein [Candidatus Neomarinimicrobiota bacterium]MBT4253140.1 hypothetical protein [Candidatus Neomarinimicrobiota bacterium]MBT4419153.1 hypothetical protein [Candidatus Neomarinimicrobiota bacterium]MBT5467382.1 hypothetical protein [Candidatus Neomarinimicrobiota bacterium]
MGFLKAFAKLSGIEDNVMWSQSKELVVDGPHFFGLHYLYIDSEFHIVQFLPKLDLNLYILEGDPIQATNEYQIGPSGNIVKERSLPKGDHEWKINPNIVHYRGRLIGPKRTRHTGKVMFAFPFQGTIDREWILKRAIEIHAKQKTKTLWLDLKEQIRK